jgi:hypothetical protein
MEEDDYGAVDRGNRAAQLEGMNYGGKVTKCLWAANAVAWVLRLAAEITRLRR